MSFGTNNVTILAWRDGLYLKKQLSEPMKSGVSVASHLIEHPIGYDGSPEHMLLTLGASLWVRQGPRWYTEQRVGLYFEDVVTDQLTQVVLSMADMGRLTHDAPDCPRLDPETEDLIWAVLVRASADGHALTGDAQIVQLAGWLRHGVWSVVERWQATQDQLYDAFTTADEAISAIIEAHDAGTHPPHRRWKVDIRPARGRFGLSPA